jgi:hypothetical protein
MNITSINSTRLALIALALAAPMATFVACSGDDPTTPTGPQNKVDSGALPDAVVATPDTSTPPTPDAGVDSAVNVCANGIVFDNATRIPGWPNVPQP